MAVNNGRQIEKCGKKPRWLFSGGGKENEVMIERGREGEERRMGRE